MTAPTQPARVPIQQIVLATLDTSKPIMLTGRSLGQLR